MKNILIGIFLCFALSSSAAAQTVGQGAPGADPWPVTVIGAITFTNTSINIGNFPTTVGGAIAIRCVNIAGLAFEACGGAGGGGTGMTDAEFTAHLPLSVTHLNFANLDAPLSAILTTAAFQARINTLGQKTSANSTPVVLPSDQTVPISAAALPLPAGAGTEATLLTLLSSTTFTSRINTLGAKTSANSTPVVLATDQPALKITSFSGQIPIDVVSTLGLDLAPGSAIIGKVGIDQTSDGTTNKVNTTASLNATAGGSQGALSAGTLAATTTAAAIGAGAIVQVLVQNDPDNVVDMLCGSAGAQPIQLKPGDAITLNVNNLNLVFCKTVSATGTVAYLGR